MSFLRFGLQQVGNVVFVAIFFGFLLLGGFTFATTPGTVTLAVAAVDVLDTLRLFMDAVGVSTMDLLDGRYFVVADLVFALVFFFH
jgi:hypothetical protein